MVPQFTSVHEKTWSPQILNSAQLHHCTGLESFGWAGELWLKKQNLPQVPTKCFPLPQELMNPADRPIWHRDGSTSVRQAHKDDKMKRCEIWVRDAQNTGCGAWGEREEGQGWFLERRWERKGKETKEWMRKKRAWSERKEKRKVTIEAFYFFLVRRKEVSS